MPPQASPAPEKPAASGADLSATVSAFSTLPTAAPQGGISMEAKPARLLEDSFSPVPAAIQPQAPAPQPPPPSAQPAPGPAAESARQAAAQPSPAPQPFPAPQAATPPVAQPAPQAEIPPVPQAEEPAPAPAQAEVETPPSPASQPQQAEPEPQPQPAAAPQTAAVTPSRPNENPLKRKVGGPGPRGRQPQPERRPVREVPAPQEEASPAPAAVPAPAISAPSISEYAPSAQPEAQAPQAAAAQSRRSGRARKERDFAAATVAAPAAAVRPSEGTSRLAEQVPVNTLSLDKVDKELIASGILAGPPKDSLTSSVPTAIAESEGNFYGAEPEPIVTAPLATTGFASTPAAQAAADLPPVRSDLPWASPSPPSEWEVELPKPVPGAPEPVAEAEPAAPQPAPAAPPDFFKPMLTGETPVASPPWALPQRSSPNLPPPEIAQGRGGRPRASGSPNGSLIGAGIGVAAVAIIVFFIWRGNGAQDDLQEKVARWTGSLSEHTEQLDANGNQLQPESTFSMAELGGQSTITGQPLLPPPPDLPTAQPLPPSTAQIDFADVPADQAGPVIVADGSEAMPEDVSLLARFQQAVAEARAQQKAQGGISPTEQAAAVPAGQGKLTPEQLEAELAAYRRSLVAADNPQAAAPSPNAFNKDPQAYMDGKPMAAAEGTLLPPPDLYTNNPNNLPVVGEPVASNEARVRTLADFEVAPFEPEREKVRVPRGLKPRLAATDFPSLEVLSFVPNRGIIAYASGREGVLLIGESLEGWQLTNVTSELAEFRAGGKRHYITTND